MSESPSPEHGRPGRLAGLRLPSQSLTRLLSTPPGRRAFADGGRPRQQTVAAGAGALPCWLSRQASAGTCSRQAAPAALAAAPHAWRPVEDASAAGVRLWTATAGNKHNRT